MAPKTKKVGNRDRRKDNKSVEETIEKSEMIPTTAAAPPPRTSFSNGVHGNDSDNVDGEKIHTNDILEEFAADTSLPGVSRVVAATSRLSSIFWIVVIVTCIVMFVWGISDHLERYFGYPKKVTVEMKSEHVPFPCVTICNMRNINFDVLNRINDMLLEDPTAMSYVNQTFDDEPFIRDYFRFVAKFSHMSLSEKCRSNSTIERALIEAKSRSGMYADIYDEVLVNVSIQAQQYVALCFMGGTRCNVTRDFKLLFDPYYFNCYTYNETDSLPNKEGQPNLQSWLTPGLDNGLSMVLLTGSGMLKRNEEASIFPGLYDPHSSFSGGDGVRVIIHDPSKTPFPLADGFDVPPGFSASLGVKPRRNVRVGPPHGDCRSEGLLKFGDVDNEVVAYDQLVCQQQCVQKYIFDKCGCYEEKLPYKPVVPGGPRTCHSSAHFPPHCTYYADDACFDALVKQFHSVECSRKKSDEVRLNRSIVEDCDCRPNCEELVYDVSYSLSAWPANGFEGDTALLDILNVRKFTRRYFTETQQEQLDKSLKTDRRQFMRDFARINVYVADPEVLVTRETEGYESSQLISDIGGQQGIWLGLSLITVAEIVELLGQLFLNQIRRRRAKRRTSAV